MAKKVNEYKISHNLVEVMINKVTKDKEKYGNSLIPLTNEELQEKIKEFQNQGFCVNTYHQEQFDDGYRFIKDGTGLDDIKKMTKVQFHELLEHCRKEVTNICKKEILNGNIDELRTGDYPFSTATRVSNIIFQYIRQNRRKTINYKDIKDILYFFSCILNIDDTLNLIYDLVNEGICFLNNFLGDVYEINIERDYLSTLLNEIYLEDLLTKMLINNELTEEEYQNYSLFPHEFKTIEEEPPNYGIIYNIIYSCHVHR